MGENVRKWQNCFRDRIEEIQEKVEEVKKLHSTILCTPYEDEETNQQLATAMEEIKAAANQADQLPTVEFWPFRQSFLVWPQVRLRLRVMEERIEDETNVEATSRAILRIQRTQQSTLFCRFVTVMTDYNQAQVEYRWVKKMR